MAFLEKTSTLLASPTTLLASPSTLLATPSVGIQRRLARIVGSLFLVFVVWVLLFAHKPDPHLPPPITAPTRTFFKDDESALGFVRRANAKAGLELSPTINYMRRCIETVVDTQVDRHAIADLEEPLLAQPQRLRLSQSGSADELLGECVSIPLTVSEPYSRVAKFPDLMFGMATTYDRLRDSIGPITHWASGRESKLVVIVQDWTEHVYRIIELQGIYRERGVNATFIQPYDEGHTTSQSHFKVLTKMVEESGPETKWFGLLDDDTFFPSLQPLSAGLGNFDHTKEVYVGALSEDFASVKNFGVMAYGGAGAYLSAQLAKNIGNPEESDLCLSQYSPEFGDIIIRDCVYQHSSARLTILPGLYQHDLGGNARGFFESGSDPLNLHHWKTWYHEPVVAMAAATNFCGNCFLQRWVFGSNTVLSNGYSITVYPGGLDEIDLNKMEHTWVTFSSDHDSRYEYVLGALRDAVPDEERITYFLKDTEIHGGIMRQLYVRERVEDSDLADEVIELVWRGADII
ncbi:hypothetical protein G7054_g3212 [Neopestalotiopsis clavispora]|nr:hypothetical protein G7054_g3212 [Neopestalotiopsis clavispora]